VKWQSFVKIFTKPTSLLNLPADCLEGDGVIRALLTFLRFLRIPTFIRGRGMERRGPQTPVRNGQFASFMSVQGCSRNRHPDRHDRRLQFQKLTRFAAVIAAITGFAWVALESAKAISLF
jgi:hypothetical protein